MRKSLLTLALWALGIALLAPPATAGGQMEEYLVIGLTPHPDFFATELTPVRWDERCVPVHFTLNTIVLPNADPPLDAAATADALQQAFDTWNEIPTSYIEMEITGERQRPSPGPFHAVFDFVNEINFLTTDLDAGIAGVNLISTNLDSEFHPGDDVDGDGDSDVFDPAVVGLGHCADVDGDGDIEFPAGFYRAGTILDADASFNNARVIWTTDLSAVGFPRVDLVGTALHEFGHAFGLAHTLVDQVGAGDGRGAVMVGHATLNDPDDLRNWRTLAADDVAWSSFVYPEGSADSGPAALGPGDVAFDSVYGVIRGEVTHGRTGWPLVGGHIYAVDRDSGEVVASHYTGRARLFWAPFIGGLRYIAPELPDFHLAAGTYTLPVPAGTYHVVIEAMDGLPKSGTDFMALSSPLVGDFFGILDFNEEFLLKKPGEHEPLEVEVEAGAEVVGIDHTTSVDMNLDPFDLVGDGPGGIDDGGFFWAPPGTIYAVRIPAAEMAAFLDSGLPRAMAFPLGVIDTSVAPVFPRAALAVGEVADEGDSAVIDLEHPLVEAVDFLGQELDFAPLFFDQPGDLAERLREAIVEGGASDFFMVLQLPYTFQGVHGLPPVIGLDIGQEKGLLGRSYLSLDGGATFFREPDYNFMFRMIFRPSP